MRLTRSEAEHMAEPTKDTITPLNVSTKEAASLLGVASHTLENWRTEGKGPRYVKHGSRVLYPLDGLRAYNEAHAIEPDAHASRR